MRLDKFISNNSEFSRTQIHTAIKHGHICVNGIVIDKPNMQITNTDEITFNSEKIEARKPRYLMLHKPIGYVSATTDSEHPTVLDLIHLPFKQELQIVGRLDIDTAGLLLLTDDGQWNHKITSPKNDHQKCYLVTTADVISPDAKDIFAQGILLHNETKPTRAAEVELLNSHTARLTICEGKYHQVKRMFAAIGNRVVALHRERIGNICLDTQLSEGQYRNLTDAEIACFEAS